MVIIIGKSGSGKTTLANILCDKYGFNRILTTTTRPMRDGEEQDVDYHFVSNDEFSRLKESGAFIENQSYLVASGETWSYGSPLSRIISASDKDVIILTPEGCRQVQKYFNDGSYMVIYLNPDINIIRDRLKARGDDEKEIERRIRQDEEDFKGADDIADLMIKNNSNHPELLAEKIAKMLGSTDDVKEVIPMEPLKIYLAGACKDIPDEGAEWRENAIKKLNSISKWSNKPIDVFNPIDYFKYSEANYKTHKQIKAFYVSKLKKCDLVLVNLNKTINSVGTGQECQYAVDHNIPIIGFGNMNAYSWISEVDCDVVFDTMSLAIDYIKDYYL